MELTPEFKIEVNEKNVTDNIKKHLVSLTFKDEADDKADSLTLNFDNLYKRPNYKDEIKVWLGYKESGLYYCGKFSVQITSKNQNSLSVSATSVNFNGNIKKKRNLSYENIILPDLVKKIAGRNSLSYKCNFDNVFFKHLSQTNEGDLHLLNRLSKMYNATFNIKNNALIFIKKNKDDDIVFGIDRKNVSSYSIKYANKTLYKSAKALYHDTKTNKVESVESGSEEPQFVLNDYFKDKNEAKQRVNGVLSFLNTGIVSGSLAIAGMNIIAGTTLKLKDFAEDDGDYSIKSVTHNLNGSGYVCRVEFAN